MSEKISVKPLESVLTFLKVFHELSTNRKCVGKEHDIETCRTCRVITEMLTKDPKNLRMNIPRGHGRLLMYEVLDDDRY